MPIYHLLLSIFSMKIQNQQKRKLIFLKMIFILILLNYFYKTAKFTIIHPTIFFYLSLRRSFKFNQLRIWQKIGRFMNFKKLRK